MKSRNFRNHLQEDFLIFDGAMGTMLQAAGVEPGKNPVLLNLERPALITEIHRQYKAAGANVITTNTFGANRRKLEGSGKTPAEVIAAGIRAAREAAGDGAYVALDIGPIGELMQPMGTLSPEEAYDIFKEQVDAAAGADLILIETMTDLGELRTALLAAGENSDLPVFCTMSFEAGGRTFTGCSVEAMALTAAPLADAIGINCSLGPKEILPMVRTLVKWTDKPIIIQPNAGLPHTEGECTVYDVSPEEYAAVMGEIAACGVSVLGGCCGTTPDFIRALKAILPDKPVRNLPEVPAAVCTPSRVVLLDSPKVIGERINPTGKKRFKEALRENDLNYILEQALEQESGGADILDVNVGLPEIDETAMMRRVVSELQSIVPLPLQIDSSEPKAIETALRLYNGKAIVNSVNGERRILEKILPLVKKYGACVVGLTLDENGIPPKAEERLAIARRIVAAAEAFGIPRRDVLIDCLTLTVSAQQAEAQETLRAIALVKSELGVKTVLGVSNISFGLPRRDLVNEAFLAEALAKGLDLPIMNPNAPGMMAVMDTHRVLWNVDANCDHFIQKYTGTVPGTVAAPTAPVAAEVPDAPKDACGMLMHCVIKGLKEQAAAATEAVLTQKTELEVVDDCLIPALDIVGERYEKGILFLPQLLQAAETVKEAFLVLKERLTAETSISKGKIILATVKGDIHDIGKNIVKIILENYGYTVLDLGRDVAPETVAEAALRENIKLVGLSALMTTTVKSMEETIRLLHEKVPGTTVFVGGAVLTQEYADQIGADYYAKDAKRSVEIANAFFGVG